jgi:hypothetical protein
MKKQLVDYIQYQNTYEALRRLIDNSYYSQLHSSPDTSWKNGSKSYLKEFCTIRMCTSRRSGHTTAACKAAHEYFDRVMFLSPTVEMARQVKNTFMKINYDFASTGGSDFKTSSGEVYSFESYRSDMNFFSGRQFDAVIVDGTFDLGASKEDEIYDIFGNCMKNNPQRFFIFIQ